MQLPLSERLRPWLGSVVVHGLLIVVLAAAAINWRSDAPPPQLAIEGSVVKYEDLPRSVRSGRPIKERQPVTVEPEPAPPVPEPRPEARPLPPEPAPPDDAAERQKQEAAERAAAAERKAAEAKVAAQRANDAKVQQQAEAKTAAAAAAKSKAEAAEKRKADEAREQQEALAARQKQQEQAAAAREAKLKAAREADLKRALESEEEGEAFARSGVMDEYRALLIQAIERNWIRPPSARAGLECTLYVTQATGGTVLDVKIGECNGDQAVRESVANAVYRSSPLPAPRDPRAFERRLVMVFKPTE
jgi:colicin import membrane protein